MLTIFALALPIAQSPLTGGHVPWPLWGGFFLFIAVMLAADMGLFHRKSHQVTFKEALGWTLLWITLALGFNLGLWHFLGKEKAAEFLAGYLLEYSLSVDNLFVFALIFGAFGVPPQWQKKVLLWGILGALAMRLGMIAGGSALVQRWEAVLYLFALFLIFTGVKMLCRREGEIHPEKNPLLRLFKRWVPMTPDFRGEHFFVRESGKWRATPLLAVLVCVEASDLIFAVDSIPAIFGITRDPFIIYTSNVFAILGLRSLYFILARALESLRYLHIGLALVLLFIGVKMLLEHTAWGIGTPVALGVMAAILGIATGCSLLAGKR